MRKNTFPDYEKAIKDRYEEIKASGKADALLLEPTPAGLKRMCLLLLSSGLNTTDMLAYKHFFSLKQGTDAYKQVDSFDTPKFKALCKFLTGNSETTSIHRLELLAVLLDMQPRPYSKFSTLPFRPDGMMVNEPPAAYGKKEETGGGEEEGIGMEYSGGSTAKASENMNTEDKATQVIVPQKFLALPHSKNTGQSRVRLILLLVLIAAAVTYLVKSGLLEEKGCMIWKNDHYEEVPCDTEVNSFAGNNIIPLDEDLLLYQKKIAVTDTTTFFNADESPRIWYGKSAKKENEYFSYPGKHPETGKELRKITQYIVDKHIKKQSDTVR